MTRRNALGLMAAGSVGGWSDWGRAAEEPSWIGKANNAFAAQLYGRLAGGGKGNLFFSPNSIQTALAMTYAGASGGTADQMADVLHLPERGQAVHAGFGAFLRELNAEKDAAGKARSYQLSVANALWAQKGYEFLPEFLDLTKKSYEAGLNEVDFKRDTEAARRTINAWVEKQTREKIKDLVQQGMLSADTRLVLANAIYFKGDWAAQFDKKATKDAPFHVAPGREVSAPLMHRKGTYGYAEAPEFQTLKLPYGGGELSMVVFLPRKEDGLRDLEKEFTVPNLQSWLKVPGQREVRVFMPRFKVTAEFELAAPLQSLGMRDAFSDKADFSGMTGRRDLSISNVVHKAFVDVNEEGTEAAAATAVAMRVMSVAPPERETVFRADHPFLFAIMHEKSGAVLFLGRVVDPVAKE